MVMVPREILSKLDLSKHIHYKLWFEQFNQQRQHVFSTRVIASTDSVHFDIMISLKIPDLKTNS